MTGFSAGLVNSITSAFCVFMRAVGSPGRDATAPGNGSFLQCSFVLRQFCFDQRNGRVFQFVGAGNLGKADLDIFESAAHFWISQKHGKS